jgi:dTDP-4-dehydrorhamnose reductase
MKILITGSNGLLGQKIISALIGNTHVDLIATSFGENRMKIKEDYTYESLDVTDKQAVLYVIGKHNPDVVINTAAMTNVDACESEKEKCDKMNVEAVKYLISACKKINAHLVHLSTDFVFDGEAGPYTENAKPNPLSYYGKSKYAAEKLIQESGLSWSILRTIIIYGIVDEMSRTNVVLWAKGALEKGQTINVVDDQFRSPTLAEDLADACIAASLKKANGIYHVSGKEIMSILDLVKAIADYYGLDKSLINPIKSGTLNQAAKRPPHTGFIIAKAIEELGYRPHSLTEGLDVLTVQLKERGM